MTLFKKILVAILTWETRLILKKYRPFVIAVTGSVGKTSTKDAIYDVLKSPNVCTDQKICYVRRSEKSMNSEVGLPLTVIGVPNAWRNFGGWIKNIYVGLRLIIIKSPYPDCLVLEVGADHPGDIRRIAPWLAPDISVITRISRTPVHVEFFNSPKEVFEEKASLAEAVKNGGTLILFGDDEKVLSLADRVKSRDVSVVSFGFADTATVRASEVKVVYDEPAVREWKVASAGGVVANQFNFSPTSMQTPLGMSCMLHISGQILPLSLTGIVGQTYFYPLLAAAAVGMVRGIAPALIAKSLAGYDAPCGRMRLLPGRNDSTLIDDTYNSSPDAARAALETLKNLHCNCTKIAILGDMLELGKYAADEHRTIGREAAAVLGSSGMLITVGPRSQATAEEAIKSGMPPASVKGFDSAGDAAAFAIRLVKAGDLILIKGSQSLHMERITAALLRDPEKAKDLLVRQEKEWLEKN